MSDIKEKKLSEEQNEKVNGGVAATDNDLDAAKAVKDKKHIKEYGDDGVVDVKIPA